MRANRSSGFSLGLVVLSASLIVPVHLFAAQPAQAPAVKEPPRQTAPTSDKNTTWKLAGHSPAIARRWTS